MVKKNDFINLANISYNELSTMVDSAIKVLNYFNPALANIEFYASDYNDFRNHYFVPTIDTLRKWGLVNIAEEETYTLYGMMDNWNNFEVIENMTQEIYAILPKQLQNMITIQERKRYVYIFNLERLNNLIVYRNKVKELLFNLAID